MRHLRLIIPLLSIIAAITTVQIIDSLHRRDQERLTTNEARADRILHARLSRVGYDEMPLQDVLADYARMAHLPLKVNWDLLHAQGINPASPIWARMYNVRAGKALSVLLDSGSTPSQRLSYVIAENGTIEVVSARMVPETAVIEIYDVSDLILHVPEEPGAAMKESERSKTQAELATDLILLITDTVDTDTWETNGGTIGRIHYSHDKLLITQTPAGHRLICNLFEQLREMRWSSSERRRLAMRLLSDDGGNR